MAKEVDLIRQQVGFERSGSVRSEMLKAGSQGKSRIRAGLSAAWKQKKSSMLGDEYTKFSAALRILGQNKSAEFWERMFAKEGIDKRMRRAATAEEDDKLREEEVEEKLLFLQWEAARKKGERRSWKEFQKAAKKGMKGSSRTTGGGSGSSGSSDASELRSIKNRLVAVHGLLAVVSQDVMSIRDTIKPRGVMAVNKAGDAKPILYMPTAPDGEKFGVLSESGKLMGIKPSKEHQQNAARQIAKETAVLMLKQKEDETKRSELRKKYAFREEGEDYGTADPLVAINERLGSIESKLSEKKQSGSLLSLLSAMLGGLAGRLTKMLGGIFDTIKSFISPIFKILSPIAKAIGHVATWAVRFGGWVMKTMWGAIKTITRGLWKLLGRWFPKMPLPAFLGGATAAVATTAAMGYALDKGMKQVGANATDQVVKGATLKVNQAEKQGIKYDEETKYKIYKKEMDTAWNADYNKDKKGFLRDQWQYSEGLSEEERAMAERYFAEKDGGSTPAEAASTGSLSVKPADAPAGMTKSEWDIYRETLASIESGGDYKAVGGAGNHYDGRYQMGKDAKTDAARILGIPDPGHTPEAREAFRNDPELQERMFAAYTQANHGYLKNNPQFKALPKRKQIEVLGYAHNQGHGGAKEWMRTGEVGSDAFGTKGTKYSEALAANLRGADTQLMADNVKPVPPVSGAMVDSSSRDKDAALSGIETVVVSAPTLVNNTRVASNSPPRNMPKADTMTADNSFVRGTTRDTVHPTAI